MATTRNPFTGNAQDERFVIQTADYLSMNWGDFPGLTERTRYGHNNLADAVSEVIEMAKGFDNAQFRIIRRTEEMVMTPLLSLNLRPMAEQGMPDTSASMHKGLAQCSECGSAPGTLHLVGCSRNADA